MKQLKLVKTGGWIALMLFTAATAVARDQSSPNGGGDIPYPFKDTNISVELAHGENYSLYGEVIRFAGRFYLKIDTDRHPWLKSKQSFRVAQYRLANDFYVKWKDFEGQYILLTARAHGAVYRTSGSDYYIITLEPLKQPESAERLPVKK